MGKTQFFGLNKFGAEGRLSDEGYKFSQRDRELMDSLFYTLMNHDHRAVASTTLTGPPSGIFLTTTLIQTSGALLAGRNFYYKFSYVDANGNETNASSAVLATTPDVLTPPESQTLETATTGGTLAAGTYKYALAFYQDAGGITTAPNLSSITVPTGTSTNTITVPLPTVPDDGDGWKIYRKAPGELEYFLLKTVADGPTQYVDDGTDSPDCTKKRQTANTTNSTNSIQLDLPPSELPLDQQVVAWRIYRTSTAGSYAANSLVASVVETTTEGGADLVTTYTDTGGPLSLGLPLQQSSVPRPPPTLDAGDIFDATGDPLPAALAPRGGRAFNLLLPGTLAVKDYHQFQPPHDMYSERIDGFYLTAPTGLTASTDYVTVRFSDNATQNEIQSLYNDAVEENEVQQLYNDASAGTFTLGDGTDTTASIAFDASAATIETRLQTDITAYVDVVVTGTGTINDPWIVTFVNPGSQNISQMIVTDSLTGGSSTITTSVEGSDGGTFTLSDGTDTTSAIAYDAAAATVETRLQTDITSITDVTVTGTGTSVDPWVIEFVNPGAQDVDTLLVDDTSLNGVSVITETTRGFGVTQVDLVIDQNQAAHSWQSTTTDFGTQEAEAASTLGDGTQVSDTLALNDVAVELNAQNEKTWWQIPVTPQEGDYAFFYWVADTDQTSTFILRVNDVTAEVQSLYNNSTSGDFTITFDGATTAAIAWNAAASAVESALELLATINNATVTGAGTVGSPWLITFDDPAGNVPQITTNDAGMDGTSTIATDTAGTSTTLDSLSLTPARPVYTPSYELLASLDGTQVIQLEVEKTDTGTDRVRVDKFEYAANLPILHGGSTVSVEVLVTGTPTTNGDDLQLTYWY
jgi:hypothetical protein